MADNLSCTVVTPAQTIFSDKAKYIGLPGEIGSFGVLKGHEPLVSNLKPGTVRITPVDGGAKQVFVVSGGYAQISDDDVIVLADDAVNVRDVDVAGVRSDLAQVEQTLSSIEKDDASRAYYVDRRDWLTLQLTSVEAAE